jgi:serine/threonine-protein kinase
MRRVRVDSLMPYLKEGGRIFRVFDLQDSQCVSCGWALPDGTRRFVKYAEDSRAVGSLENAIRFAAEVKFRSLPALRAVLETDRGLALVYDWADGEVLGTPEFPGEQGRSDPRSPHYRFLALPLARRLAVLEEVFRVHVIIERSGWVGEDFYDGSIIYDFDRHRVSFCDFDHYHRGPWILDRQQTYGSSRFRAPEEKRRGSRIDTRTSVHTMGRTAMVFLSAGDRDGRHWQAPRALLPVALKACSERPRDRYPSVLAFAEAWGRACPAEGAGSREIS